MPGTVNLALAMNSIFQRSTKVGAICPHGINLLLFLYNQNFSIIHLKYFHSIEVKMSHYEKSSVTWLSHKIDTYSCSCKSSILQTLNSFESSYLSFCEEIFLASSVILLSKATENIWGNNKNNSLTNTKKRTQNLYNATTFNHLLNFAPYWYQELISQSHFPELIPVFACQGAWYKHCPF